MVNTEKEKNESDVCGGVFAKKSQTPEERRLGRRLFRLHAASTAHRVN